MPLKKDLQELLELGMISASQKETIEQYYRSKKRGIGQGSISFFGIIGALLLGLGLILIISHNWYQLSLTIKTGLTLLPLLVAQLICAYTIGKKLDNKSWREGSSIFLSLCVGAAIALISQIYNIQGDIKDFIFNWMLLCFPLVYLMRSTAVAILVFAGFVVYALLQSTAGINWPEDYYVWFCLIALIPHYLRVQRYKKGSVSESLLNWSFAISFTILLFDQHFDYNWIAIFSLLGFQLLSAIGYQSYFIEKPILLNPFKILGGLGQLSCLYILSFMDSWQGMAKASLESATPHYMALSAAVLVILIVLYLYRNQIEVIKRPMVIGSFFALPLLLSFFVNDIFPTLLSNIPIIYIGIFYIVQAGKEQSLVKLNLGLLTIISLIVFRFVDSEFSYTTRGVAFILTGALFIFFNYYFLKKKASHES